MERRFLKTAFIALALSASAFGSPFSSRTAQDDIVAIPLYRGEDAGASNVKLGSWGSGKAIESKENVLIGDNSIRITTHGLYQGGRLEFKKPVDLAPALANKFTYLRMQMRFDPNGNIQDVFNPTTGASSQALGRVFDRMRFVLTMADGSQYELLRPFDMPPTDDIDAYVPIHFPIQAIVKAAAKTPGGATKLKGEGAKLKSLAICGDKYQVFTLGEMEVVTDDSEIDVAPLDDQITFADNDTPFTGNAEGGAATLKFSWDFDSANGFQEESVGRTVNHVFRLNNLSSDVQTKEFIITLRVSDYDGIKKPKEVTLKLEVAR